VAEELGDAESMKAVKQIMQREDNSRMWFFINRVTDDPKSGGVVKVERMVNGQLETNTEQDDMVRCIQEETEFRFHLAHSAKITNTTLAEKLGYLSDAHGADALITGQMDVPDDVDDVTALIVDEISQLGMNLMAGNGKEITVAPEDFKLYWKQAREKTNSSMSLVHFGHYKAATTSDRVSAFLAKKITMIARSGCPPKRWGSGLQLMLEKIAGIALINKL